MTTIASQITSLTIVYSTVYSGADQRKHQSSASLAFVRGIHRWPVDSPYKEPVRRKMFQFDDVIMVPVAFLTALCSMHIDLVTTIKHLILSYLTKLSQDQTDTADAFYWIGLILIPAWIFTCPVKCGIELTIHSQTLVTALLKFENG